MLIDGQNYDDCDLCGETVKTEYGFIAQGATGRYCVVLTCCKKCVVGDPTPIAEAREKIERTPGASVDF